VFLAPLVLATALATVQVMDHNDSLSAAHTPVRAIRLSSPVNIDGALNEEVWKSPDPTTEFLDLDPVEGATPSQRTEVRVAYDDDAIYIGARMYDTAPDSIITRLARRDVEISADRFSVYLDPYHDRRSGYYFKVNAAGTLYDGTISNDGWTDSSWDGVWTGRARRDAQGWTAELRIPFSQMRFVVDGGENIWGINFSRNIARNAEGVYLVYQPKKESGFVSRFPHLTGLSQLPRSGSVELIPYVTAKAEYLEHTEGDPFYDGSRHTGDAGGDLRMSVAGKLTLNATVNPDFGQVEVDPAVVNLSDFETYYPEKRPFFVEGSSNFRFGNEGANNYWGFNWPEPTFFYSRRVGRPPQGEEPSGDYVRMPSATTILGAAKLTGKIAPTWNFGTLHALTAKEHADVSTDGFTSEAEVEPLTYYGVVRTQKEFPRRQQGLGFMANWALRSFDSPEMRDALNSQSYMGGVDGWVFLDRKQTYVVSGWSVVSHVRGTEQRMIDLQRDPRHYFQRPDADHVEVDSSTTHLTGSGTRLWINKQNGQVIMNGALGYMTPSFDVNDVGFMSRTDVINGHFGMGYKWTDPNKWRKYQDYIVAVFANYDWQGNPTWLGTYAEGSTEFINNYSWSYHAALNPQTISNRRTRGGPLMITDPGYELGTYFDTDSKSKLFYYVDAGMYSQPKPGSWNSYLYPAVEWKPVSNFNVSIGPGWERVVEDAQYVGTYDDPTATATYGQRYVFSDLNQTTVSANIRLNCSFTPSASLELYLQPLVSSGDYTDFKELARPRSYEFNHYGQSGSTWDETTGTADPDGAGPAPPIEIGNPDFNFRSLRGNAVFRWEYRPGSTLFLVWTQERVDSESYGNLDFSHSMHSLVDKQPQDVFLAKVTYYLGM
jgi:hypothetical protein